MDGYLRRESICGFDVEIYEVDGEEYVAIVDGYPHLDIRASSLKDLKEEIDLAISVERELDKIWYGSEPDEREN